MELCEGLGFGDKRFTRQYTNQERGRRERGRTVTHRPKTHSSTPSSAYIHPQRWRFPRRQLTSLDTGTTLARRWSGGGLDDRVDDGEGPRAGGRGGGVGLRGGGGGGGERSIVIEPMLGREKLGTGDEVFNTLNPFSHPTQTRPDSHLRTNDLTSLLPSPSPCTTSSTILSFSPPLPLPHTPSSSCTASCKNDGDTNHRDNILSREDGQS